MTASAFGLIFCSFPFVVIAALVRGSSSGPVFFRQKRIGKGGKCFQVIKFRTMFGDTESQNTITRSGDPRITPVGKFLRRFKLDELPQLWNVFMGKMSFVGPRPDVPGYADKLEEEARKILELRPGITGPATLYFRNEEELLAKAENPKEFNDRVIWPKKVQLNLCYYYHWSFWRDIGYIIVTVFPALDRFCNLIPQQEK
jgi:lipopolysaccharide/colanic/teichoic acid biosynthesis glycosyltransferase